MSTLRISDTLLDGYVALFQQLAPSDQSILLDKLTETTSTHSDDSEQRNNLMRDVIYLPKPPNAPTFEELAGSWIDDRSAAEIVEDLRRSRTPNRDKVNL